MGTADDDVIWDFAASHDLVIVSKDEDFHQRAFLFGPPPKVIWVRLGNCTTQRIGQALQSASALVTDFYAEPGPAFLVIEDSGSRDEPEATRD